MDLSIRALKRAYSDASLTPRDLISMLLNKIREDVGNPIWIEVLSEGELEKYLARLSPEKINEFPLYGIPFAVKDNIDVAGVATTAACKEFAYVPKKSAFVVQRLIDAGAIPLGKTNMDQFATGLVGTRSPWGPVKNAFDESIISGGSSSGSALALALGQVSFSLGTDTAGSGRVPAALNNLVGLKPSRGLLSCSGVVPACKSLDCVSIFSLNIDDANRVFDVVAAYDSEDTFARKNSYSNSSRYYKKAEKFRIGIPQPHQLNWFGLEESSELFSSSVEVIQEAGGEVQELDFQPFIDAAKLLYEGPWVAERYLACKNILDEKPRAMLPVISEIISAGKKASAGDAFSAQYKLNRFKQKAWEQLELVDALVTPTIPRYYRIEEVSEEPIKLNSNLGYYTNYMNLLDCCAVALPCGFYENKVGFGLSLVQRALHDKRLLSIASSLQQHLKIPPGLNNQVFAGLENTSALEAKTYVDVVVCGAHLKGLPLNWQLRDRGAQLISLTKTSAHYRFYALPGGPPLRPGLVRVDGSDEGGTKIEVEVWRLPSENFGSFVEEIPVPLGIGKVELEDGQWLSGFICDHWGLENAEDISRLGSWRVFLQKRA